MIAAVLSILAQSTSVPISDDQSFRVAEESCNRAIFSSLINAEFRKLADERLSLLNEGRKLLEQRRVLLERKQRRRHNGPLAGIFNSDTNEVEISEAEQSIKERQGLLDDRKLLLDATTKLRISQIDMFKISCQGR